MAPWTPGRGTSATATSELVWSAGPNQFVEAELADLPPGRAVDLAAGEGRNAIWLARQGWQVTAVDFSQVGARQGRSLGRGPATSVGVRRRDHLARGRGVRRGAGRLPAAAAAERARGRTPRLRRRCARAARSCWSPTTRPTDRGHRRPAGPGGADDRRGRAGRPRRASRFEVQRAERVARIVAPVNDDGHREEADGDGVGLPGPRRTTGTDGEERGSARLVAVLGRGVRRRTSYVHAASPSRRPPSSAAW